MNLIPLTGSVALWILHGIGVLALTIFIERLFALHRAQIRTSDFLRGLFTLLGKAREPSSATLIEAISICDQTEGPVARMMRAAITVWDEGSARVRAVMEATAKNEIPRLERHIGLLYALAQAAPMAGLLGTVLGILQIQQAIKVSATPLSSPDLASGLEQAIYSMALGLVIAIPSYVGYNFLVSRVESILLDMERACADVETHLTTHPRDGGAA